MLCMGNMGQRRPAAQLLKALRRYVSENLVFADRGARTFIIGHKLRQGLGKLVAPYQTLSSEKGLV